MQYPTPQENFWAGEFGVEYIERNQSPQLLASNLSLFSSILRLAAPIESILELGANVGMNLQALRDLLPTASLSAVEINSHAATRLREIESVEVFEESAAGFARPNRLWDLTFTKGVLIHINPELLPSIYDSLYISSKRYIMICEYYNPVPVSIHYRGHSDRLFKRDFAGDLLARFSDLKLVDYGFIYHRDPLFPQDDCTWFLMQKMPK